MISPLPPARPSFAPPPIEYATSSTAGAKAMANTTQLAHVEGATPLADMLARLAIEVQQIRQSGA